MIALHSFPRDASAALPAGADSAFAAIAPARCVFPRGDAGRLASGSLVPAGNFLSAKAAALVCDAEDFPPLFGGATSESVRPIPTPIPGRTAEPKESGRYRPGSRSGGGVRVRGAPAGEVPR